MVAKAIHHRRFCSREGTWGRHVCRFLSITSYGFLFSSHFCPLSRRVPWGLGRTEVDVCPRVVVAVATDSETTEGHGAPPSTLFSGASIDCFDVTSEGAGEDAVSVLVSAPALRVGSGRVVEALVDASIAVVVDLVADLGRAVVYVAIAVVIDFVAADLYR